MICAPQRTQKRVGQAKLANEKKHWPIARPARFIQWSYSTLGLIIFLLSRRIKHKGESTMLRLLIDVGVLWFLLNIFSDENWDDQKLKILGIVLAISILGGLAANVLVEHIGLLLALVIYYLLGTVCLWALASLRFPKAAAAMGIFVAVRLAIAILFAMIFTS